MKEKKEANIKAMELLLYRNRTEAELRKKLLEREYSEEETEAAIQYVKSYGYLNDRAYAEQYVLSRSAGKGRAALKRDLRAKGLEEGQIEEALAGLPEDDTETILDLIRKRAGEPHKMEDKEYRRLFGFLARRGFSGSSIHRALKQYSEQDSEQEAKE